MFKNIIQKVLNNFGYSIQKEEKEIPCDMDESFREIFYKSRDFTMTSVERAYSLYKAIEYISKFKIPGDIVECGVWKGGSVIISARTLLKENNIDKNIYLYDTFDGMSEPTEADKMTANDFSAEVMWKDLKEKKDDIWMCYVPVEEVKKNVFSSGYPKEKFIFVKGKVEDTIPKTMPEKISLLRLDTDWFESTQHELTNLFPKLAVGGILIIDDYGHWKGARKAVDDYFRENKIKILLNRIDCTGVIGIKE